MSVVNSPDLVASLHSDPLGNRPVLLLLLSKEALDPERLVGRLETTQTVFQHLRKQFAKLSPRKDSIPQYTIHDLQQTSTNREADMRSATDKLPASISLAYFLANIVLLNIT